MMFGRHFTSPYSRVTVMTLVKSLKDVLAGFACAIGVILGSVQAFSQPVSGGVCHPVSERKSELGCWIIAHDPVGEFPTAVAYWYLYTYGTRAAAEGAKGPRGTVVESLGKIWLLTVERAGWHPVGGELVSEIGPIPIKTDEKYSAQYMEVIFNPGMTSMTHRHGGPEVRHTLAGETCLETPNGKVVGRAGGPPVIIPDGPMHLTATGTEQRRALVLILHQASKPATTLAQDWTPKGLCKQ
jgi:quercetin dioxygenase-like cupin family protein